MTGPEDRRRDIARRWMAGRQVDLDDLLSEALRREGEIHVAERPEQWDDIADDMLLALSAATEDDPAGPWNHAGYHTRNKSFSVDAGIEFIRAAAMLRRAIAAGSEDPLDSEDWLTSALAAACRCFLRSGRPLAAVAVWRQMSDSDDSEEIRESLDAWIAGAPPGDEG